LPIQLPLDLETPDRFSRERLIVTPTLRTVVDEIEHTKDWLAPHVILLGAAGSGKTHLAHIFARQDGARFLTAEDTHRLDTAALDTCSYVVDDAENASEETLFHLINHIQKINLHLVITTKIQPILWRVTLPDLASRLRAMRLLTLPEPDEALLIGILHKLFEERAISPSPDLMSYLAQRMDRSVAAAQKIVTELEHYANGRPFNRTLARSFIESRQGSLFGDLPDDEG